MIATFTATEAGTYDDEDGSFISTGVACADPPHHLLFSRSLPFGGVDDWGIEIEFDGQINGGCGKISRCVLQKGCLSVKLNEPIGQHKQYDGFEVQLQLGEVQWTSLAGDLRKVFMGHEGVLEVEPIQ